MVPFNRATMKSATKIKIGAYFMVAIMVVVVVTAAASAFI